MRTPSEVAAIQVPPVAEQPRVLARDGAGTARPFSQMLAEAEAVQDVVRLSRRDPGTASAVTAWRDGWLGLCRGANLLLGGELGRDGRGRRARSPIPRR
jgi:hypothetical protein